MLYFRQGAYLGVSQEKLRFFTPEGELVSTPEELAQQAEQGKQRANQENQHSDRLAAKLRE